MSTLFWWFIECVSTKLHFNSFSIAKMEELKKSVCFSAIIIDDFSKKSDKLSGSVENVNKKVQQFE